jgi:predicted Zn-dependent peptidase
MTARLALSLGFAAGLLAQVKLPPYTREILPNGVTVDLMPRGGVPLVGFRVLVKGGGESDPADRAGLASVTAQLLRKGTAHRTADQFSQELDFLGGTFQTDTGSGISSATVISAEFLAKDFERGLQLVSEAVLDPVFPNDQVSKLLAQRLDAAKSLKDNAPGAINRYFHAFFFGPAHPFGRTPDEITLARISRDDVVHYHQRMYCGRNLVVIVFGDFESVRAGPAIRKAFGQLASGEAFEWPAAPVVGTRRELLLIDKPDATQTYFYIGQPGIDRKNPDRIALELVNMLFGGRFTSMLNEDLRVNSGLTYGALCQLQEPRLAGSIVISSFTKTETTSKAIDMAIDVLKRLGEKGITAEQLASAKTYFKGTYPPARLQTADQLASRLEEFELYGLGREDVDNLFARIDAVTLEQANSAARKYYRSDNLTFVLLGNAAKIREAAARYASRTIEVAVTTPGFVVP